MKKFVENQREQIEWNNNFVDMQVNHETLSYKDKTAKKKKKEKSNKLEYKWEYSSLYHFIHLSSYFSRKYVTQIVLVQNLIDFNNNDINDINSLCFGFVSTEDENILIK
jgi:hypothetical protein